MVEYQPMIVESYRYYLSVNKSITCCSRDRDMGYHVLSTKVNTTGLGFSFRFVPVYHVYNPQYPLLLTWFSFNASMDK